MAHLFIRSVSLPSVGENQVKTGHHWRIFADYSLSSKSGIEVFFNVEFVLTHNTSLILSKFLQSLATIKYPKMALGPADELRWLHELRKCWERGSASAHRPIIWLSWSTDTRYHITALLMIPTYIDESFLSRFPEPPSLLQNRKSSYRSIKISILGKAADLQMHLNLIWSYPPSVSRERFEEVSQIMLQSNPFSVF